jgi:DNA-binding NarL/FixJ family response regulator
MQPIVLLAEDHYVTRKGLKILLEFDLGIKKVNAVSRCNEIMQELSKQIYTHLILDIVLPDGSTLEILHNIKQIYPRLQIMIFSMQSETIYGEIMKKFDIFYYASKNAQETDTLKLLHKFIKNERPFRGGTAKQVQESPFAGLSQRQLEVLHYLLKGFSINDIATTLNLKQNRTSALKTRILEKTGAGNVLELSKLASLYLATDVPNDEYRAIKINDAHNLEC